MLTLRGKTMYEKKSNSKLISEYKAQLNFLAAAKAGKENIEREMQKRMKAEKGGVFTLSGKGVRVELNWSKAYTKTDHAKMIADFKIDVTKYQTKDQRRSWSVA